MKKLLISTFTMCLSASVMAGGLNTNSNQNASFERQMSQNGIIDIAGMYANPAGTAFLANGWHFQLTSMSVWQQRNITTSFPLFPLNTARPGESTHEYKGTAKAPVIPSLSVSYNRDKWSANFHFSVTGGGGKCDFPNGLGSFESLVGGTIVSVVGLPNFRGYSLDSKMEGHSYVFGAQIGGTYKILPNLSAFAGVRLVYGNNGYDGYIHNITALIPNPMDPTGNVSVTAEQDPRLSNIDLDCTQKGWGVTPIIGLDWKATDYLNLGVKYEIPTKMVYKNTSTLSLAANAVSSLAKFRDGYKVREDLPGILSMGAMATPIKSLRMMIGWNVYFDSAVKKGIKDDNGNDIVAAYKAGEYRPVDGNPDILARDIDANTWEMNIGVEYDICKYLTVSGSWQRTTYGISDTGMSDLSFNNTNNMFGFGVRVKPIEHLSFDLGFMHTIYQDRSVITPTAVGNKNDLYIRRNDVLGVGVIYEF